MVVVSIGLLIATRPRSSGAADGGTMASATPSSRGSGSISIPDATVLPTPTPTPTATALALAATRPPRASGVARLAYAEFLSRVNDDRATVAGLNRSLSTAADAQDPPAVRSAAVEILDFVDIERDWLRAHPPAECYAAAHASATAMLDAYGMAADRFVDWSATGGGLAGLGALGRAVDAARAAGEALAAFGTVLEATRCPV